MWGMEISEPVLVQARGHAAAVPYQSGEVGVPLAKWVPPLKQLMGCSSQMAVS